MATDDVVAIPVGLKELAVAIDLHDGTVYVQRLEPYAATEDGLTIQERAILTLYRDVERLQGELAAAQQVARELATHCDCVLCGPIRAANPWLKEVSDAVIA